MKKLKTQPEPSIEMVAVESTNIHSIGHNGKDSLHVAFHNGSLYKYTPLDYKMFLAFKVAKSKGSFFFKHIKSNPGIAAEKIS